MLRSPLPPARPRASNRLPARPRRGQPPARIIDQLKAGTYRTRLAKRGIEVAVRVWFGPPMFDGEELDRSPRWCVEVNGWTTQLDDDGVRELLDPYEWWPFLRPISEAEFLFMTRRRIWASEHMTDHPAANPRQPIDLKQLPAAW